MTPAGPLDPDWQLRLAAFAGLRRAAAARGGVVTAEDLDAGFEHQARRREEATGRRSRRARRTGGLGRHRF